MADLPSGPNIPTRATFQAALQQLAAKWKGQHGVARLTVQSGSSGLPVFLLHGVGPRPPAVPNWIILPAASGVAVRVSILWRDLNSGAIGADPAPARVEVFDPQQGARAPLNPFNERDVERAMWSFFTPTTPAPVEVVRPAFHVHPVPTAQQPPPAETEVPQISVDGRLPQYNLPNFWAKPWEPYGCLCCTFYQTPTLLYSFQAPQDYLLIVDGIAFDVPQFMTIGEAFDVTIRRDGENILTFEEVVIDPLNPDPSLRCLFTSTQKPLPLWIRFDRNQQLTVEITLKGLYPFTTKTSTDTFCGVICALLHGWFGSLMDNRDGAARPIDVGGMRDGDGSEVLSNPATLETAEEKALWLNLWLARNVPTQR